MQLVSYQIKECFGFRDSDPVDLQDPTNLIYILGRNSFGKTSFLTALAYFAPGLIPKEYPNFANFDPSFDVMPYLLGKYKVEGKDFTIDAFTMAYRAKMGILNPDLIATVEFEHLSNLLAEQLRPIYADLIDRIVREGSLWVRRSASGEYQFSIEPSFEDSTDRNKRLVPTVLSDIEGSLPIQGGQRLVAQRPFRLPSAEEIESLLANQLPIITWFNKAYALLDVLPNVIKIEHLNQDSDQLTATLVRYLGKSKVERFLRGQNPREGRALLNELQEKITMLMGEVNRGRVAGSELLAIDLYPLDGLQITVMVGDKPSFYRHLSDNTKLLFAYHLYKTVYNLRGNILLFDEPNNGFHATAQERLLGFLRNLGDMGNQVIISTHSEYLIDLDHLTCVRLMKADDQGYLSVRNKWYGVTTGRGDFDALRPILDAIGLRYGSNHLSIRDKVIVTEGVTELLYLQATRQLLGYEDKLDIAPATGDATIMPLVALLISQGLRFKVVLDTSVHGKSTKEKLREGYGIPDTSICEVEIPAGFPQAKGSGIEDIFSKADFAKLLTSTGNTLGADFETLSNSQYMKSPGVIPKRVVAHEFNKHVTNYCKNDFDEETLTNMRRILDFCLNDEWFLL